jgi:hypothetical protein
LVALEGSGAEGERERGKREREVVVQNILIREEFGFTELETVLVRLHENREEELILPYLPN